jgi:chromosome segregation ATPase
MRCLLDWEQRTSLAEEKASRQAAE